MPTIPSMPKTTATQSEPTHSTGKSTNALLQELVDMKKEEMHRNKRHRMLIFFLITLPTAALVLLSIYASWTLLQSFSGILGDTSGLGLDDALKLIENL